MTSTKQIYFITGNAGKIHEAKYAIGDDYFAGSMNTNMTEIQSDDYQEIITQKAQSFINAITENWPSGTDEIHAIVEDTGLECANMNGFPGPYIRYYFDKLGLDGICKFNGQSVAIFVSHSAAVVIRRYFPRGTENPHAVVYSQDIKVFEARVEGSITLSPSGTKGFGFDPIFLPTGNYDTTLAEMDLPEKQAYSARITSIRQARDWLVSTVQTV